MAIASTAKASELRVSASPSAWPGTRHIAKPPITSSSHSAACHPRNRKESSNSADVKAQNTTLLPDDKAISGNVQMPSDGEKPAVEVIA